MSRAISLAATPATAPTAQSSHRVHLQAGRDARPGRDARAAHEAESLLPPAIKGLTFGFVGGVIAIVALMAFAPSLVHADEMGGTGMAATSTVTPRR